MTDTIAATKSTSHALMLARIGAAAYVLWGLWHIRVVVRLFDGAAAMESVALQARMYQGAFHILFFALFAIVVAWWTAQNNRVAYWAQLITIGWTEVGLFLFFMWPGLFPAFPSIAWVGPLLWVVAVATTSLARRGA